MKKVFVQIILFSCLLGLALYILIPSTQPVAQPKEVIIRGENNKPPTLSREEIIQLINEHRANNGLGPLVESPLLDMSAEAKAKDMKTRGYFSHIGPNGEEPWVFFDASGYQYGPAAENIMYGGASSKWIVEAWVKSPRHNEALLGNYLNIGVGLLPHVEFQGIADRTIAVAHFATPR